MGIRKFFGFKSNKPIGWANRKSRFVTALSLGISNESTKMRRTIMYAALVIMVLGPLFYGIKENLNVLDTLYFLVIMWTTVGYGDIIPSEGASRDFTIFYLCLSVLLIGAVLAISREYQSVVRKKSEWDKSQHLAEKMRSFKLVEDTKTGSSTPTGSEHGALDSHTSLDSDAAGDAIPPPPDEPPSGAPKRRKTARSSLTAAVGKAKRRLSVMATSRTRLKRSKETLTALQSLNIEVYNEELEDIAWSMLCDLAVFIAVNFIGAGIMVGLEGWAYDDALYWAIVTITTVGLGDFSPETSGGKVFTIFFAVFGVFYVSSSLNELAQYPMMLLGKRNEIKIVDQFGSSMDEHQVESLINNDFFDRVPTLRGENNENKNKLSRAEFVLMVLNMMDKLPEKDVILLSALFDSLDSDHDGFLTQADVEVKVKAVRRRSQKMAEAAEKGLPPPPDDDDDDDLEPDAGPGMALRPLASKKSIFPGIDTDNGNSGERNETGASTIRRPTFMNPIEERESEVTNPMSSMHSKPSFMKAKENTFSSDDSDDGGVLGMVTQRRPTFSDSPEKMESNKPRPLSKLFGTTEGGERDDEASEPPTDGPAY